MPRARSYILEQGSVLEVTYDEDDNVEEESDDSAEEDDVPLPQAAMRRAATRKISLDANGLDERSESPQKERTKRSF